MITRISQGSASKFLRQYMKLLRPHQRRDHTRFLVLIEAVPAEMVQAMSELRSKRLAATYEVQVKIDGEWRVANATEDREQAILEAVTLTGEHHGLAPVRVLGELNDVLTNSVRACVVWRHKPPPQLPPADAFELKREQRVNARKVLRERPAFFGLGGALLLGLLALAVYVGTHIHMENVRY